MNALEKKEWLIRVRANRYEWATDDQWLCIQFIFEWELGEHHLSAKIKPFGMGVEYNGHDCRSTYDFDGLTRLVLMAHRDCVRVEIASSAPRRLKIICHKRHAREGGPIWDRHPTIEQAIEWFTPSPHP